MSKTKLPKLYKRTWLNKDKGTAYVVIDAEVEEGWGDYKEDRVVSACLDIKDCSRQVSLEFYYNTNKQYKQRLAKMEKLKEEIQKLHDFMLAHPPVRVPRKKASKEEVAVAQEKLDRQLEEDLNLPEGSLSQTTEAVNDAQDASIISVTADIKPVSLKLAK